MGKQKRARQKYHLAKARIEEAETEAQINEAPTPLSAETSLPWNILPTDDMFSGLDIDIGNLKKTLMDDDGKSVKSLAKSIKSSSGKLLKKEDKRKLRHNLFIKKIDAIYDKLKESKKGKKKKKQTPNEDPIDKSTFEYLLNKQPVKVKNTPAFSNKNRGIKKAKERKELLLKDIDLFKKILSDPKYVAQPLDHVRNSVQNKVLSETV